MFGKRSSCRRKGLFEHGNRVVGYPDPLILGTPLAVGILSRIDFSSKAMGLIDCQKKSAGMLLGPFQPRFLRGEEMNERAEMGDYVFFNACSIRRHEGNDRFFGFDLFHSLRTQIQADRGEGGWADGIDLDVGLKNFRQEQRIPRAPGM